MEERRKHRRFIIEGMDIHCKMLFSTEVRVLNISFGGAALSLSEKLNMGAEYTLKIESEESIISVPGIVVWEKMTELKRNERGEMVPHYEVGIQFRDVFTYKGNELVDFIESNLSEKKFRVRLKGLRVNIVEPEKATILGYHKDYTVKMISLGGMLIETDMKLEVDNGFHMELSFPEDKEQVQFLGRVAYCSEISGKIPRRYDVGIEFIEMEEYGKKKLREFIDLLQSF
ncbi:MAG TPA: PilZ domain-containing protein [Thermodesulfovibrionales bacterium]|nr:PilZ domain-containing protein [Thermodesulfovibrionales bacterium]